MHRALSHALLRIEVLLDEMSRMVVATRACYPPRPPRAVVLAAKHAAHVAFVCPLGSQPELRVVAVYLGLHQCQLFACVTPSFSLG